MRYSADNIKIMREDAIKSARIMNNKSISQNSEEKPYRSMETQASHKTARNPRKSEFSDFLGKISGMFSIDSDRLIILCIAFVLIKEKANKNLLLALLYIFL